MLLSDPWSNPNLLTQGDLGAFQEQPSPGPHPGLHGCYSYTYRPFSALQKGDKLTMSGRKSRARRV